MSAISCPKCSGHNIYQERDRTFEPDPWILVCHTCGHRIYGEEEIRGLIQRQAPHLVKAFSAHIAARKAEIRENIRPAPSRPIQPADSPRRGRVLVHCALCGIGIWRRPYDVKASPNKRFFCSLDHLTDFKRREMEDQKATHRPSRAPAPRDGRRPTVDKRKEVTAGGRRGALMVHCAVCGKGVWRRPWDVKTCKSGLFFCSGEHRLHWLRSGQPLVAREGEAQPAQMAS